MRRVVITGIGLYSSIGIGKEAVASSLYKGKSGIICDNKRLEFGYRSPLTGMVEEPNLKNELSRRQRLGMGQPAAYAYAATKEAINQAKMDLDYFSENETGVIFGNDSTAMAVMETIDKIRSKKDTTLVGSGDIFKNMNCTVTMNLATIFKLKGINLTLSAACASGSHSIGMGMLLIQQGLQERVICGGAQEINPYAMGSFDGLGVFSMRTNRPHEASRPFDRDRDGLIPSGGAATLVLESLESAQKRDVAILGEIVSYGFSGNGEHLSNPNLDGQKRSLEMALRQAGLTADKIDYINAHATSTPAGDSVEAQAIFNTFGSKTLVSSTKSITGHECWMAGASELAYTLLMMQNEFVAANKNFKNPDEHSEKLNIVTDVVERKIDFFLSNSFGFGGTNSSVIVKNFVN